ncbi:AraC family transcriptional regulator [Reichenbachiella sp. MALMAid0571]|uniref:AraC family transcriptional regulator n=1 Tax=Reichenbachiella sp. MALMAid0571 TaxID=3143939 RepID=UPI0032DFEF8D
MEPLYQKVEIDESASFFMKDTFNPLFHFHPEYELILFREGTGRGIIGDKTTSYEHCSFFMLGPNLPHCFTSDHNDENKAYVIQLNGDILDKIVNNIPETKSIHILLEKAKYGLKFYDEIGLKNHDKFKQMFELKPFERLITILSVLNELSKTTNLELLTSPGSQPKINLKEYQRINTIYEFVFENFKHQIKLAEVSSLLNMTEIAFCRYFKKITRRTFITYLNEYRIGHACKLLSTTDKSVSEIAFDSGYESIANFNKQFRKYTGINPRKYQDKF